MSGERIWNSIMLVEITSGLQGIGSGDFNVVEKIPVRGLQRDPCRILCNQQQQGNIQGKLLNSREVT